MRLQELKGHDNIKNFIFGGSSIITLLNKESGKKITFKVIKATTNKNLYWVYAYDRISKDKVDFKFMGCYLEDVGYKFDVKNSVIDSKDNRNNIAYWFFNKALRNKRNFEEDSSLKILYSGRCGKCLNFISSQEEMDKGFHDKCLDIHLDVDNINLGNSNKESITSKVIEPKIDWLEEKL